MTKQDITNFIYDKIITNKRFVSILLICLVINIFEWYSIPILMLSTLIALGDIKT